ncbi:MAG TPA: four helix bundle protein [Planctomycetota bacterium]|nr:four helix bundle protein [Planctomycetota bacterium]
MKNEKCKMNGSPAYAATNPRDIQSRTFSFALRIIKLCRALEDGPRVGWSISRQLMKSGTSIGANMEEATAAQSKADFISKVQISLKEARETNYWLRLLSAAEIIDSSKLTEITNESDELCRILGSIVVSAKNNGFAAGRIGDRG